MSYETFIAKLNNRIALHKDILNSDHPCSPPFHEGAIHELEHIIKMALEHFYEPDPPY